MDPYEYTQTLQTWLLTASWSVYLLMRTASFSSIHVTTAQHCGRAEERRRSPLSLF